MLDRINRLMNRIAVKNQSNNTVHIGGIDAWRLSDDIQRIWGTSRFMKHMFRNFSSSGLSLHNFYLPDFVYILETIIEAKNTRSNKRMLKHLIEVLLQETWLQNTTIEQPAILDKARMNKMLTLSLFDYQDEFIDIYNRNVPKYRLKGYVCAMGAGAGKTITALALSAAMNVDVFVVCCPKNTMRSAWQSDVNKAIVDPATETAFWSDTMPPSQLQKSDKYYFLHYESMGLLNDVMIKHKRTAKRVLIVVDESHNFNDKNSQRSQRLVDLVQTMRQTMNADVHVLFMSGTPVKQMGSEMIPCLGCIDPMFQGQVVDSFKAIYGLTSSRANDILRHRLGFMMHVVPKEAYRKTRPEVQDVYVKLPNGSDYTISSIRDDMAIFVRDRAKYYKDNWGHYRKIFDDALDYYRKTIRTDGERKELSRYESIVARFQKGYDPVRDKEDAMFCNVFEKRSIMPVLPSDLRVAFKDAKSVIKYVGLKIQGEALARVLGAARIRCHVDMVEYIDFEGYINNAEAKVLIFTSYVQVVERVDNMLRDAGFLPEPIYGKTNKNINQILARLRDDPDSGPAIATFDSLAEGVPMLMCNVGLFLNNPWRSSDEIQAISRLDRVGQTQPVRIYRFMLDTGSEGNVSTRSHEIMELSRQLVEEITGVKYVVNKQDDVNLQETLAMEGYDQYVTVNTTEYDIKPRPAFLEW